MKVYVILEERYEPLDGYNVVNLFGRGFKTFERAEQTLIENGFIPNDKDNDSNWNEYRDESGETILSINEVLIPE